MPPPIDNKETNGVVAGSESRKTGGKLSTVSGVYIPVFLNILSILLFLRFGVILGHLGFVGMIGEDDTQKPATFYCLLTKWT